VEVNLDPTVGSEAGETRPGVAIQNDIGNRFSQVTIFAAILLAENVPAGECGLTKDSVVQCNQIRTVDEKRLVRTLGQLSPATMLKLDTALKISLAV
jgi:mRNA interferase MazF